MNSRDSWRHPPRAYFTRSNNTCTGVSACVGWITPYVTFEARPHANRMTTHGFRISLLSLSCGETDSRISRDCVPNAQNKKRRFHIEITRVFWDASSCLSGERACTRGESEKSNKAKEWHLSVSRIHSQSEIEMPTFDELRASVSSPPKILATKIILDSQISNVKKFTQKISGAAVKSAGVYRGHLLHASKKSSEILTRTVSFEGRAARVAFESLVNEVITDKDFQRAVDISPGYWTEKMMLKEVKKWEKVLVPIKREKYLFPFSCFSRFWGQEFSGGRQAWENDKEMS